MQNSDEDQIEGVLERLAERKDMTASDAVDAVPLVSQPGNKNRLIYNSTDLKIHVHAMCTT
jgi:hypothetical protein